MVITTSHPATRPLETAHRSLMARTVNPIVARAPLFHLVDPAAVAALMAQSQPAHFSRRQQIYGEGEPGDQLYIVTAGTVKLGTRAPDGRNHLFSVVGPSEMFGELCVFDPGPRTASATALTVVVAVVVEREVVRRWVADRPEIAERLLRVLARRLRRTDDDMADLVFTDVAARVAKQLLRLAHRFGVQENGALRVTHHLTQEDIAQLIGACRETVNKILTEFSQRGWIRLDGHSLLIIESASLLRRAQLVAASDTGSATATPVTVTSTTGYSSSPQEVTAAHD